MPSRAVTSFLLGLSRWNRRLNIVSMPSRAVTSFLRWAEKSDLLLCFYCVNALSGCYLISTVPFQKPRFYAAYRACFCRYLSEYSDNSCFSCMLTIWTYFMRYTYPWHCIKYSTKCSCCHPIFNNFKSLLLLFSWHPFTSSF